MQAVLDSVIEFLPATDIPPIRGIKEEVGERPADDAHLSPRWHLKLQPFVGTLTFFRYSGVVNTGDAVFNPVKAKKNALVALYKCTPKTVKS